MYMFKTLQHRGTSTHSVKQKWRLDFGLGSVVVTVHNTRHRLFVQAVTAKLLGGSVSSIHFEGNGQP
jgi:NO-binding membrane sensor protein with MHYT domain